MDALTLALSELKMQSTFYCKAELSAPWGFSSRYEKGALFYIVTQGCCWLEVEGVESRWLREGDFVVLSHSYPHSLHDSPGSPTQALETLMERYAPDMHRVLHFGGGGARTHLLGGCFWFEEPQTSPLLHALPPLLYRANEPGQTADWLQTTLAYVAAEATDAQPGAQSVITRLSDILFIQAIRAYLKQLPEGPGTGSTVYAIPRSGRRLA